MADVAAEQALRVQALVTAGLLESVNSEEGLVFPLPANSQITRVLSGYDTRDTTNIKVRCSACAQHQFHNRGFRVEIEGGGQSRIGIQCGEKHFGTGAWHAAVADYDRRVEHAQFLARVKPALEAIEQIAPILQEWHRRTNLLAKWLTTFRVELNELFCRLAEQARRSEGRLERERRRKRTRINRQGGLESYTEAESVVVGRIPYPGMFLGQSPTRPLNGATAEIGSAYELLSNKSDTRSLAHAFAHLRRARQHLNEASEVHRRVLLNLTPDWLPELCDWANKDDDLEGGYAARGSIIVYDGAPFALLALETIGSPSIERINELWP